MKKIITLLLSAGIFTATYAQSGYQQNRRQDDQYAAVNYGHNNDYTNDSRSANYHSYKNQKEDEIERINNRYMNQMMSVQNNYYMTRIQKKRAIRSLQNERDRSIKMVNEKYKSYRR